MGVADYVTRSDNSSPTHVHGLFIGINHYPAMKDRRTNKRDLKGCANDAKYLAKAAAPILSTSHVLTNEAATRSAILDRIEQMIRDAEDGDLFLMFCACHGGLRYGELFLEPSDFDQREFLGTGLLFQDVANAVGSRDGVRSLVILDACHSGAIGFDPASHNRGSESSIMVAAGPLEASQETRFDEAGEKHPLGGDTGRAHGVFGFSLMRQLDRFFGPDGPGKASIGDIFRGAYGATTKYVNHKHHPIMVGTLEASTTLERRKAPVSD